MSVSPWNENSDGTPFQNWMPGNFKMLENISAYLLSYVLHNKTKNYIIAQIIIFKISIGFEVSGNVLQ